MRHIFKFEIPKCQKYKVNVGMANIFKIIGRKGTEQKSDAYIAIAVKKNLLSQTSGEIVKEFLL